MIISQQLQRITEEASVAPTMSQPTPSHNEKVRRKIWTMDENKQILRSYFRVTNLETYKTTYRTKLFQTKDDKESAQPDEEPSTAREDNNSEAKNEVPAPDCESVWVSNYERHLIEYRGMDPNRRPKLPKMAYKPGLNLSPKGSE
ncbi:hypothetical protein HHI36_010421 [Cryptolaemus montrouzieri]|uniref:Uncharacterized protein n=1 Tax=Cryptolaemus montrouzieri TaxID=559131 RepID=A0ABD2MIN7_9CUCU